jgi:hypothetical protein
MVLLGAMLFTREEIEAGLRRLKPLRGTMEVHPMMAGI